MPWTEVFFRGIFYVLETIWSFPLHIIIMFWLWILFECCFVLLRFKKKIINMVLILVSYAVFLILYVPEAFKLEFYLQNLPIVCLFTSFILFIAIIICSIIRSCITLHRVKNAKRYIKNFNENIINKLLVIDKIEKKVFEKISINQKKETERIVILLNLCSKNDDFLNCYKKSLKEKEDDFLNELKSISNEYDLNMNFDNVFLDQVNNLCTNKKIELREKIFDISTVTKKNCDDIIKMYKF